MSRSVYDEDGHGDNWATICWRGAVKKAIKGKRGQDFLKEMLVALDALSNHALIANELEDHGAYCAIGAVGKARNLDMSEIDPEEHKQVAKAFSIAPALASEIMYMNDEVVSWIYNADGTRLRESSEQRFVRMRKWVLDQII